MPFSWSISANTSPASIILAQAKAKCHLQILSREQRHQLRSHPRYRLSSSDKPNTAGQCKLSMSHAAGSCMHRKGSREL